MVGIGPITSGNLLEIIYDETDEQTEEWMTDTKWWQNNEWPLWLMKISVNR